MDDTLKNVTLGLFGLFALQGGLEARARQDATRQVVNAFHQTGTIQTRVTSRGALGLLVNDLWAVDIFGEHVRANQLPFYVRRRSGWKGSIRYLRLHFTDFTLNGYTVDRFEGSVPFAKYDLGHALWKRHLWLRDAKAGTAFVETGFKIKESISKGPWLFSENDRRFLSTPGSRLARGAFSTWPMFACE